MFYFRDAFWEVHEREEHSGDFGVTQQCRVQNRKIIPKHEDLSIFHRYASFDSQLT